MLAPRELWTNIATHSKRGDPFLFGGGMINTVYVEGTTFADAPDKFIAELQMLQVPLIGSCM